MVFSFLSLSLSLSLSPSLRPASKLLCGVCGTKLTETLSRQEDLNTRMKGRSREGRGKGEIRFTLFCVLELLKSPVSFQMLARLSTSFAIYHSTIYVGIQFFAFFPRLYSMIVTGIPRWINR